MNNFYKLKIGECKLLGKYASSYCYNQPKKVILGLTRRCNLNCIWCQRQKLKRNYNVDIDFMQARAIAESVPKNTEFHICGLGEQLLYDRKDLLFLIRVSSSQHNVMTTNGVLLDKKLSTDLLDAGLDEIHVSVDSPYESVYNEIRGFPLKKIKENIRKSKVPVVINTVLSTETKNSFVDMIGFAKDVGVKKIHVQNLREWSGKFHRVYDTEENRLYVKKMERMCEEEGIDTDINKTLLHGWNGVCYQLFTRLYINPEGFATPCCGWEFNNLVKCIDVQSCWNNEDIREFRKRMLNKEFPSFCVERCIKLCDLKQKNEGIDI